MFRILALLLLSATTALSADPNEVTGRIAVANMESARQRVNSITINSAYAAQLVGMAQAEVSTLPARYQTQFQSQLQQLRASLTQAVQYQTRADFVKSGADGGYSAVMQRVSSGNWYGVATVANDVARMYYQAHSFYAQASNTYSGVGTRAVQIKQAAQAIKASINR